MQAPQGGSKDRRGVVWDLSPSIGGRPEGIARPLSFCQSESDQGKQQRWAKNFKSSQELGGRKGGKLGGDRKGANWGRRCLLKLCWNVEEFFGDRRKTVVNRDALLSGEGRVTVYPHGIDKLLS